MFRNIAKKIGENNMSFFANLLLSIVAFSIPFSTNPQALSKPFLSAPKKANQNTSVVEGFHKTVIHNPETVLDCEDGYVVNGYDIYKMEYTSQSSLFIIHSLTGFTPGHVARVNDLPNYKDYSLKRGYVHLEVRRAQTSSGGHGGTIYPKLMWPSSTTVTTVESSTSSIGLSYNYGTNGGVSLGLDGVSITAGSSKSTGLTFQFSHTISSQFSDPIVSNQFSSGLTEAQWSFEVRNRNIAGNITFTFDQYYLFELQNDYYGVNIDAFDLIRSFKYQGQYTGFMWATYDGWEFFSSHTSKCLY